MAFPDHSLLCLFLSILPRFNRIDSVIHAHRAKVKAILGLVTDHRYHAVIVNRWGGEINCVVRARLTYDDSGTFLESVHTWMPLPDPKPPTIAQALAQNTI